ncbi:hypothetical protein [Enterococcus casseliflavus]|uniref:hypothetical protein n=1 Tax=Enterococcus casseliflavus TaxID=37734 RepID=UPI003019EDC2
MEYKGYKVENDFTDTKQFKGVRIHLYNNNNGKYGFIEIGKEFDQWGSRGIRPKSFKEETWRMLTEKAIDSYIDDSTHFTMKYTLDFIQGIDYAIQRHLTA